MIHIFDVDGTLTPSRDRMKDDFAKFFEHFATHNSCYLVTGSDREKTLEQIPESIYNLFIRCYQCSGNHVFEQHREVHRDEWKLPDDSNTFLLVELHESGWKPRTGQHFDNRPGLCNFSVVGRGCSLEQRHLYKQWDEHKEERIGIATRFNKKFGKTIRATVAGETGIDITPVGKGKSQILRDFDINEPISFYGDKTIQGGNDYDLAAALNFKNVHQVEDWRHTWKILLN